MIFWAERMCSMKCQAAWMVNDKVYTGHNHAEIINQLGDVRDNNTLRHGYVDVAGTFYNSIEELYNSMKEYMIIRHAETQYNTGETDFLDSKLTSRGIRQAIGLGEYLQKNPDSEGFVGFVSPYRRALQTAYEIHTRTNIQFKVFPLIAEYGAEWSRVQYEIKVEKRNNEFSTFDWSLYDITQTFGAESFNTFLKRMKKVLEFDLPEKTLIVSHGAVVYTLVDLLTGGTVLYTGYDQVTNASVSFIRGSQPIHLFKNDWKGD